MNKNIAKFEKVSYSEFERAINDCFPDVFTVKEINDMYEKIELPKRATDGSAGYDFYSPVTFQLTVEDNSITFPTGIKCRIDDGWVLMLFPRSSVGFKYGARLANTVGIIDSDFYNNALNEGDIQAKICGVQKPMIVNSGERIMQGIFVPYGVAENDNTTEKRNGGTGSTGA